MVSSTESMIKSISSVVFPYSYGGKPISDETKFSCFTPKITGAVLE